MHISNQENSISEEKIDIYKIVQTKNLVAYFQPIISVTAKKIIGLEGLIRGIKPATTEFISPLFLFESAYKENLATELDRACRDKVLTAFQHFYQSDPELLLFLNLDTAIIDNVGGSDYLNEQVKKIGLNSKNIVIEINESKAQDTLKLTQFVNTYKRYGYLIALDDVGAGFSNMDRVAELKPDIIKIDRSIIQNIDCIYHKQEVFKSLVNLANKIGSLIIAEGVETKNEAIQVLKLGGQVIQGFYFSKPQEHFIGNETLINKATDVVSEYKALLLKELEAYNQKCLNYTHIVNGIIKALIMVDTPAEFNVQLLNCIDHADSIDCVYILDESGIQFSNTIGAKNIGACEKLVFHSAKVGVDHSIKNFYYNLIKRKQDIYITDPYVSMATGSLCITYSRVFKHLNKKYILCVDFLENLTSFPIT